MSRLSSSSDQVGNIKLSPNGEYYAARCRWRTAPSLAIIRRGDNKVTANFSLGENTAVAGLPVGQSGRVMISVAEKFGALDSPQFTGELYAMNVDGAARESWPGCRVRRRPGTTIQDQER